MFVSQYTNLMNENGDIASICPANDRA